MFRGSELDLTKMRGKGGDIKLKNDLDLDLIDEDDLLKEMFDMEQAAKQSM